MQNKAVNEMTVAVQKIRPTITLFTPYFRAASAERQAELDLCLRRNLQCGAIERVVLLVDDSHTPPETSPKLHVVAISSRPTYQQWVELSARYAPGLSVLANSDIYFDESINALTDYLEGSERFVALSRYDLVGQDLVAHPNPRWSQDVWALDASAELPPALYKALDIPLGVPRCDNKIAYLFAVHGWKVFNPMAAVRSVHVHETQQRNYNKKTDLTVIGGVAYVHPANDASVRSKVEIDVWALGTDAIQSVALNRSLDKWTVENGPSLGLSKHKPNVSRSSNAPTPIVGVAMPPLEKFNVRQILQGGKTLREDRLRRFRVLEHGGKAWVYDGLYPDRISQLVGEYQQGEVPTPRKILETLIPPVLRVEPITIKSRPDDGQDCQFWQYPAATEKQALDNHLAIAVGGNINEADRTVHTYLGLPWATYIDKKNLPEVVNSLIAPRLKGLHRFVSELGWTLRVHTVCQQIHWQRFVDVWSKLSITDLHISHATNDIDPVRCGWPFHVHSWPLIAPNIEVLDRREGLVFGKPVGQRRWFASFIGAHMPHYRSDVRLRLQEAAKASGRDDFLVELTQEWHFNKTVYMEQVHHKSLQVEHLQGMREEAKRYNGILSDSVFSLCPEGAGPNTLRLWESLAVGAIPVVLADGWRFPTRIRGLEHPEEFCLFVTHRDVGDIVRILDAVPIEQCREMQARAIRAYSVARAAHCF